MRGNRGRGGRMWLRGTSRVPCACPKALGRRRRSRGCGVHGAGLYCEHFLRRFAVGREIVLAARIVITADGLLLRSGDTRSADRTAIVRSAGTFASSSSGRDHLIAQAGTAIFC
jgi:hypothetical protein